jgi:hypothetical protein
VGGIRVASIPFIPRGVFDDKATRILGQAFEAACKELHDTGQPEIVREIVAKRIIAAAPQGRAQREAIKGRSTCRPRADYAIETRVDASVRSLRQGNAMKKLVIGTLTTLAIAIVQSTVVARTPKDIAARIEAIPIQTLTISDQQFLMADASGRPTTIAGTLRVARGSANPRRRGGQTTFS